MHQIFSNISDTATGATVHIFELDLTIVNTIILSFHWIKLVNPFESYRADRRTDGHTKRNTSNESSQKVHYD